MQQLVKRIREILDKFTKKRKLENETCETMNKNKTIDNYDSICMNLE